MHVDDPVGRAPVWGRPPRSPVVDAPFPLRATLTVRARQCCTQRSNCRRVATAARGWSRKGQGLHPDGYEGPFPDPALAEQMLSQPPSRHPDGGVLLASFACCASATGAGLAASSAITRRAELSTCACPSRRMRCSHAHQQSGHRLVPTNARLSPRSHRALSLLMDALQADGAGVESWPLAPCARRFAWKPERGCPATPTRVATGAAPCRPGPATAL